MIKHISERLARCRGTGKKVTLRIDSDVVHTYSLQTNQNYSLTTRYYIYSQCRWNREELKLCSCKAVFGFEMEKRCHTAV